MEITQHLAGLRTEYQNLNDATTYRRRLAKRIAVARKRLGISKGPKGGKSKADKVAVPSADSALQSPPSQAGRRQLLLLQAERNWAGAMEIKQKQNTRQSITSASRTQITSRLSKAIKCVDRLIQGLEGGEATLLEAVGYRSLLYGTLGFERSVWGVATASFSKSWLAYEALSASSTDPKQAELFRKFKLIAVESSFRIAGYQSTKSRDQSLDQLARQAFPKDDQDTVRLLDEVSPGILEKPQNGTHSSKSSVPTSAPPIKSINWRTRTVNIEDASLSQALGNADAAIRQFRTPLSKPSFRQLPPPVQAERYDPVLIASQDVIDAVASSISELTSSGVSSSDKKIQNLQIIRTASTYDLISWRIGRNRVLVGADDGTNFSSIAQLPLKKRKHHEAQKEADDVEQEPPEAGRNLLLKRLVQRVALLDASIKSFEEIEGLPGIAADADLKRCLSVKKAFFDAIRSNAVARSHFLIDHLPEGIALLAAANSSLDGVKLADLQLSHDPTAADSGLDIRPNDLERVKLVVNQSLLHTRATYELVKNANTSARQSKARQDRLVNELSRFTDPQAVDLKNLVSYPPKLQPIPVKPLFLDAAWNYIDYPGQSPAEAPVVQQEVKAEKAAEPAAQEKKRGWFGFGR